MSQSLSRIAIHLTFSTKNRKPWLRDADLRKRLYAYMAGIFSPLESPAILIGGVEDHAHILFNLSRSLALKEVVGKVKAESSAWIKKNSPHHGFYWQAGYGAFSVSESNVENVRKYCGSP